MQNRQLSVCCVFRCLVINCIEICFIIYWTESWFAGVLKPTALPVRSTIQLPSLFFPPLPPVDGRAVSFSSCRSPSISRGLQSAPLCHTRCLWYNFSSLKQKKGLKKQWLSITRLIVSHASFCALVDLKKKKKKLRLWYIILFCFFILSVISGGNYHRLFHEGTRNVFFIPETILVAIVWNKINNITLYLSGVFLFF